MFQTPDRSARKAAGASAPARRAPSRLPGRPAAGRPQGGGRSSAGRGSSGPNLQTWLLVGAGVLALLLLWKVVPALVGGGDGGSTGAGVTGANGAGGLTDSNPAPEGSRTATFPGPVEGTRLEFRVIGLGRHPAHCTPRILRIGEGERVPFHHSCAGEEGIDRYYFLVRLANLTDGLVSVRLSGFTLTSSQGDAYEALPTPPLGSPSTRFFPPEAELVVDGVLKKWVTFDGSEGFTPAELTYEDGAQTLTVRFEGDWS